MALDWFRKYRSFLMFVVVVQLQSSNFYNVERSEHERITSRSSVRGAYRLSIHASSSRNN
jgi:hypothetical protein